jgi:hypothetical protein
MSGRACVGFMADVMDELVKELFRMLQEERQRNADLVQTILSYAGVLRLNDERIIPIKENLQNSAIGKRRWPELKAELERTHKTVVDDHLPGTNDIDWTKEAESASQV